MIFVLGNTQTVVCSATNAEIMWLSKYLTFQDNANIFRRYRGQARAKRVMAPKIHLYDRLSDSFPTGLVPFVAKRAKEDGFIVDIDDKRSVPPPEDLSADLRWLRPYQLDAVTTASRRLSGIVRAPTGAGKTEMIIGITRRRPGMWLFVVHRVSIAAEFAERYNQRAEEAGIDARAVRFRDYDGTSCDMVVATFQSLRSMQGTTKFKILAETVDGLIVDECHGLPANTYYSVAADIKARMRLGFSGTPLDREDKRSLMAVGTLGPIICEVTTNFLIEKGYLSKPKIVMLECMQDVSKPTYQGIYGEGIVRSHQRNKLLYTTIKNSRFPAIVFVKELRHGKRMQEMLEMTNIPSTFVWGNTSESARLNAVKDLERGDIHVVVASIVWQEGVDIPSLKTVIMAAGGKSTIATLQKIGRGMRVCSDGDNTFDVWDVYDMGNPTLQRHSRLRKKAYERLGFEVVVFDPTSEIQCAMLQENAEDWV